mgnify:CR=1 FL=1
MVRFKEDNDLIQKILKGLNYDSNIFFTTEPLPSKNWAIAVLNSMIEKTNGLKINLEKLKKFLASMDENDIRKKSR